MKIWVQFNKSMNQILMVSFLIGSVFVNNVSAQQNLSSPKAAIAYFKYYTDSATQNLDKAASLISSKYVLLTSKQKLVAQDIRLFLDAIHFNWNSDSIPDDTNYVNKSGKSEYILATDIALIKLSSNWVFTKNTTKNISDLLKAIGAKPATSGNQPLKLKNKKASSSTQKLQANATTKHVRLNLSSPQTLVSEYEKYMSDDNFRPDVAQQIIYYKHIPHKEDRIDRIIKLNRFLEGKGVLVKVEDVPNDPDFIDTLHANAHEYIITPRFAELYLEKIGDRWYLSKESVNKIPDLFNKAFPFGSDKLLNYLPKEQTKYLGLMLWQYLAILALIVISFVFHRLLNWSIHNLITRILFKVGKEEVAKNYVKPVVRPLSLMIALILVDMFLPILQLPLQLSHYISLTIAALIPFMGTMGVYKFVDLIALYFKRLASQTDSTLDDQLVPLFRKIIKTFVVVIGAILVLANLNVQLMPLLATLSIGGFAFALAAQDTIKNFFGSLMIFVDKPFQVGQWITASGIDGTVEEVGIRSTRIRTFSNSLIYVPNGKLADATIDNHGLRAYRRFSTQLALTYDTPPELIELFIEGLRKIVLEHPKTWKENFHVYMNDMNSHSLDIKFYIFFGVPTWAEELKCRHEIILSILKLAKHLGVNFAFPTQTLHVQDLPGQPSLAPIYDSSKQLQAKLDSFFRTKNEAPDKG